MDEQYLFLPKSLFLISMSVIPFSDDHFLPFTLHATCALMPVGLPAFHSPSPTSCPAFLPYRTKSPLSICRIPLSHPSLYLPCTSTG